MIPPQERTRLAALYQGSSGPQNGREESITFEQFRDGIERVVLYTTRPATVADLLQSDRPIESIEDKGETIRVVMPGDEYRMGGVLGALRRHVNMSEEQRAAAGERLKAARRG